MTDPVEHALGVWLNQPHEDYLADLGLGYGGIKDNYLSPIEWWDESPYNPLRKVPERDKAAFLRGGALHTFFLDGERVYKKVYAVLPTAKTHPEYLNTVSELVAACNLYGLSTYGLKDELTRRLVKAKAPVKILSVERKKILDAGKVELAEDDDARIQILHRMAMRSREELRLPDGDHLTLAEAFKGALTEVSIYWIDENGIRQRARFDMLKPNFIGDLKSITQWRKGDFKLSLLKEIILRGYAIQWAHYDEARRQLRIAVEEGRVFGGNKTQLKRLAAIARAEEWAWLWVFAKMDGAPQVRGIIGRTDMLQYGKAVQQRQEALNAHLFYKQFFGGYDTPWFDPEVIWQPDETDWPSHSVLGEV